MTGFVRFYLDAPRRVSTTTTDIACVGGDWGRVSVTELITVFIFRHFQAIIGNYRKLQVIANKISKKTQISVIRVLIINEIRGQISGRNSILTKQIAGISIFFE